jgi:SAM-dependent methyltransferase
MQCPLCHATDYQHYFRDSRDFFECCECRLVFVPAEQRLSRDEEKAHYDLHENSPNDSRYRAFLNRLCEPLCQLLRSGSQGLDFGCGPGPTLSVMLEEKGHEVCLFDSFFEPDSAVFESRYDFVTASEVVEHLHNAGQELDRLWNCLRPGGVLGIMTKRVLGNAKFSRWHYKNDPTHVCFFSVSTFEWLARLWNAELFLPCADVAILKKPRSSGCSCARVS